MIRTDSEYRIAVRRSQEDKVFMEQQRKSFADQGFTEAEVEVLMQPFLSFHAQLTDEIEWYQHVCSGDELPVTPIGNIGRMLISLRLSRGLTQKQFAQRLGVSEAQVSRDENNEYHGITIERVQRILNALNASVETKFVLMSEDSPEYQSAPLHMPYRGKAEVSEPEFLVLELV